MKFCSNTNSLPRKVWPMLRKGKIRTILNLYVLYKLINCGIFWHNDSLLVRITLTPKEPLLNPGGWQARLALPTSHIAKC